MFLFSIFKLSKKISFASSFKEIESELSSICFFSSLVTSSINLSVTLGISNVLIFFIDNRGWIFPVVILYNCHFPTFVLKNAVMNSGVILDFLSKVILAMCRGIPAVPSFFLLYIADFPIVPTIVKRMSLSFRWILLKLL